jgi:hypothetical protein
VSLEPAAHSCIRSSLSLPTSLLSSLEEKEEKEDEEEEGEQQWHVHF